MIFRLKPEMYYKSLQYILKSSIVTSPLDFSGSGAMDPKSMREKAKCWRHLSKLDLTDVVNGNSSYKERSPV